MLKEKGYRYLCVSRIKLKDYQRADINVNKTVIYDIRGNPIEPDIIKTDGIDDSFLYIPGQQKAARPKPNEGVYFVQTNLDESQETTL